uniref:Uncharacterized protein n=1 Tax=Aegilops tauschii TaxID=37682 RepID=M8D8R0_AEGTA
MEKKIKKLENQLNPLAPTPLLVPAAVVEEEEPMKKEQGVAAKEVGGRPKAA